MLLRRHIVSKVNREDVNYYTIFQVLLIKLIILMAGGGQLELLPRATENGGNKMAKVSHLC